MCPHKMCFSVLLIAAAGAAGSAPGRIGVSRVSLASGDVWRFTRDGEVIAWPIGHNHPHSLWDPCNPGDAQCLENDLFHSKYGGDIRTAAAAQLKQYAEWGFNAAGYDAPIEHWEQLPFMTLSTPLDQPVSVGVSVVVQLVKDHILVSLIGPTGGVWGGGAAVRDTNGWWLVAK